VSLLVAVTIATGLAHGGVPTPESELSPTWAAYRKVYVSEDGRAIDYRESARSTSEGQSYAMVRALWAGDRDTFDRAWLWTNANLQAGDPARLPAWAWGKKADDTWGVLDPQPASDADQFMAWSLLGASRAWDEPRYAEQAVALLARIWAEETEVIHGERWLLPGPWARGQDPIRLNPSYFLPFAWRSFAEHDTAHDWRSLLAPAYRLLEACRGPVGLPKDWCYGDRSSGRVVAAADPRHDDFGFEAFRVAWTLAAEVKWHGERRARALLGPYVALLSRPDAPVRIPAIIGPDGAARVDWSYPGMYGALLPAWSLRRPAAARRAWLEQIVPLRADHGWGDPNDYYGQNWIWLGLALWQSKEKPA